MKKFEVTYEIKFTAYAKDMQEAKNNRLKDDSRSLVDFEINYGAKNTRTIKLAKE